jgi:hypothetical protein
VKGVSGSLVTGADMFKGGPGTNGSLMRHLADGGFLTTGGHLKLTPSEVQDFVSGAYYVVLYTTRHPEGEMRGQVYVPCGFIGAPPPGCSDPQFAGIPAPTALHDVVPVLSGTPPGPAPTLPPPPENPGVPPGVIATAAADGAPATQLPRTGALLPPNTGDAGLGHEDQKAARAILVGIAALIIGVGLIFLSGSPGRE